MILQPVDLRQCFLIPSSLPREDVGHGPVTTPALSPRPLARMLFAIDGALVSPSARSRRWNLINAFSGRL